MELRPYQRQAVAAVYEYLRAREDNPCVVIPTGGGKTPVIATICRDAVQRWSGRVLILAHVRELLEQVVEKLHVVAPELPVGVYSAGLKRRDLGYAVTIAGIQSVYERAGDVGPIDLVIVDEAHLIPPDGEGMYRSFLAEARVVNHHVRVIGLTATPFRLRSGTICAPENILNAICYEIGVRELIVQGYLSPLRTKAGTLKPDTQRLHERGGEFVAGEVESLMNDDNLVLAACREIVQLSKERKSVLIFASGVRHGLHICKVMEERHHVESGFVCGETLPFERDELIQRFRAGTLKYLCNVNVLTTGFDAPNVDCVALVRPTLSPGLYYQMVGRGFRLHPGKEDCLVLDFGGNVLRHGPVDVLRVCQTTHGHGTAPAKECPKCHALIATAYSQCPECGHEFPPRHVRKHDATATHEGILSGQVTRTECAVTDVSYHVHYKKKASLESPPTMRVEYRIGFNEFVSEWICFEHDGRARHKSILWWKERCNEPVPDTVEEAVDLAQAGTLAPTQAVIVERKAGESFARVVDWRLGDVPPRWESADTMPTETAEYDLSEVPF